VEDIELVLFDLASGESNLPTLAQVAQLANLAAQHQLTYTVHLPLDLRFTAHTPHPSLKMAERIIELTAPLQPYAYVFHLDGDRVEQPDWLDQAQQALATVISLVAQPQTLALENLESYDPEFLEPLFAAFPIARALDIGHLWKAGLDPLPILTRWLPQTRVIHLHGMAAHDHQSLMVMAPVQLDPILRCLSGWAGVLTLEVFEDDFFTSRTALAQTLHRITNDP
jgi:sugar phosphate isomerase/epimerase